MGTLINALLGAALLWAPHAHAAHPAEVLILSDGACHGQIETALSSAGHSVTQAGTYVNWTTASFPLVDTESMYSVDLVIWCEGTLQGAPLQPGMDTTLSGFLEQGAMLVRTEQAAYQDYGRYVDIYLPVQANGTPKYTARTWDVVQPGHPLVADLPPACDSGCVVNGTYTESLTFQSGGAAIVSGDYANPMVSLTTQPGGRSIHINNALTLDQATIDPKVINILTAAANWAVDDEDFDGWRPPFDCDDFRANVNPGQVEVPGNQIDEDCNGVAEGAPTGETGLTTTETGTDSGTPSTDTGPDDRNGKTPERPEPTDPGGSGCGCASPTPGASAGALLFALVAARRRLLFPAAASRPWRGDTPLHPPRDSDAPDVAADPIGADG